MSSPFLSVIILSLYLPDAASSVTPVDISNWRQFDLPKPILKAIGDLGSVRVTT